MTRTTGSKTGLAALATLALVAGMTGPAHAEPGDLDATFGNGGIASSAAFGGTARGGTDMVVQPDGKVVVVGMRGRTVAGNFGVWRFTANGAPDLTFSGDGVAVADFGGNEEAEELALLSDGRIAVVGTTVGGDGVEHAAVAVLSPSGKLDPSFSSDGRVIRGGGVDSRGYAVAIDALDRIIVAGLRDLQFAMFRYTPTGTVDRSFGGTGVVEIAKLSANTTSNFPESVEVATQPDGRILALGIRYTEGPSGGADCGLARVTPGGSPDTTFSGDGFVRAGFPAETTCPGLALSSSGAIAVIGTTSASPVAMARFTPTGALDTTLDGDGRLATTFGAAEALGFGVTFEGQKMIAVGAVVVGGDPRWVVARLMAAGQPDATFGDGGQVVTDIASCCSLEAAIVPVLVDGRIMVEGQHSPSGGFSVAAYEGGLRLP
jgi:uncharacterized delta-60 repeat protein